MDKPSRPRLVEDEPTRKVAKVPAPPVSKAPQIDERFLPTYEEDENGNPAIDLLATKIPDPPLASR